MTRLLALIFLFSLSIQSWAVTTSDYSSLNGKSGSTLYSAVNTRAHSGYSGMTYAGVWTAYQTTDVYPAGHAKAGKIWDMYSNSTTFTYSTSQCGNYSAEGDCYNREHSIPKSWFGQSNNPVSNSPGTDLFHLVATDGYVNSKRSNYAFGEVSSATYTSNSGCKVGSAKSITLSNTIINTSGSTTQSCSSSPVFEPMDEFKGDFARGYFGTLLSWMNNSSYNNFTQESPGAAMFQSSFDASHYYGLTAYGVVLLLKWHREDPVSQKEIDRNNAVEVKQGNRNPFIDYPILAEYIWGKYAGNTFNTSNAVGSFESAFTPGVSDGDKTSSTTPTLAVSANSVAVSAVPNGSNTVTFTVTGASLTSNITISKSGTNSSLFTVSPTSISSNLNSTHTITITYSPTATGTHTATIAIASTGAESKTVSVTGTCAAAKTVTWKVNGSAVSTESVASGGKVSALPSDPSVPSGCSGKTFVGWTNNAITSETDTKPTTLFTDVAGSPTITADITFYAVFATGSGSGTTTYTLASSIASGDQVVIACNTQGVTAGALSNQILGNVSSTFSSDKSTITSLGSGTLIFTIGGTSGAYTLSTSDGALGATAVKKLAFGSGTTTWSISISSGTATITNTTSSYGTLYYNSGSPRFTTYTSSQTAIQLYKVTGGTSYSGYITTCSSGCTPIAATASFASNSKTTTCGGSVSNAFTTNSDATPTFTSSNTSVATVDNSGAVTVVGQGTTTITGSVAATTCFTGGASASYTLTVNRTTTTASFNSPTTTLNKGASATNVVTTNSDATVTYTSSNPSVATVNSSGKVTAVSAGTTTITATIPQNSCYTSKTATYTLTVYDFQATAATNVTSSSFTANWTSAGANSYSLDVYYGTISSTTENRDTTWVSESFDSNQGDFTIENVSIGSLSYVWSRKTYNNNGYMNGSAYVSSTNNAAESWLLSPEIDLTNATSVTVSFEGAAKYQNGTLSDEITLWIAEEPSSTFNSSEWTQITIPTYPTTGSWTFVSTGNIDITAYKDKKIKLAVKYLSTSSAADTYELDNFLVTGKYNKITNTSSITHVTGYPKSVTGTSASVTGLNASTTYYYTVTPNGGSESNVIEVTTSEEACSATLTVQYEDTQGTGAIQ